MLDTRLALDCDLLKDAEKLIYTALSAEPPAEIAEELRDLLEEVHFQRHLGLRGISLHNDEIQMSIAGKAVGYGIAPAEAFIERVEKTETLLYRTAERKQQKPYRDRGRRDVALRESFELYMSAPRAASFAVTFKVGKSKQLAFSGTSIAEQVIDELLECLEIFTRGDEIQLRERITEEAYYRNFVGLAQGIAPDGQEVDVVGFTTIRNGHEKTVALTARKQPALQPTILLTNGKPLSTENTVQVSGILKFADSRKEGRDEIQIVDSGNVRHTVVVPPGMMSDIVKPLWDTEVLVTGVRKGNKKVGLQEIRPLKQR